jgi:predicted dehydrogenase
MVKDGELGKIRVVQVEYPQDWLTNELPGNKQADWRTDPQTIGRRRRHRRYRHARL